jgi:hypothetical protein
MQPDQYIKLISESLAKDGNQVIPVQLQTSNAIVGYQNTKIGSLLSITLHLFTVVTVVPELNISTYEAAITAATTYALKDKAGLTGFRKKVAVLPIIVTLAVDTETTDAASRFPNLKYAAITAPVIVDIMNAQSYSYSGKLKQSKKITEWIRARLTATLPEIQKKPVDLDEEY